jgi:hypothetical protein
MKASQQHMKAIHQIISYLSEYGLLTREELIALTQQGFYPTEQVFQTDETVLESDVPAEGTETDQDDLTEAISSPGGSRTGRRRGGKGGGRQRVATVEVEDMCERLASHIEAWRPELTGLTHIGRQIDGSKTWENAAVAVRNSDVDELTKLLIAALENQSITLADIWQALNLDSYNYALDEPGLSGSAVVVYRIMLKANGHSDLGSYGSLLANPEVAAIFNLRLAQRRLAQALGQVPVRRPDLLAVLLRRDCHEPAYWSFVLLYNARRGTPGKRHWPRGDERRPPQPPPPEFAWPTYWAAAVGMDHAAVTPYLLERAGHQERRASALQSAINSSMSSLPADTQSLVNDYYVNPQSPADLAARHRRPVTDIDQALDAFKLRVRQTLSQEPALHAFLFPENARQWDAFLAECMRFDVAACLSDHFPATMDLLCPKNWN